jgi:phenylacetate-CoA ligase
MLYNQLLENIILPVGDLILGKSYIKTLHKFRRYQKMDGRKLEQVQRENLKNLLKHATENVSYYKSLNLNYEANPYHWIKNFPILYKNTIKENLDDMIFGDKSKLIVEKSSGSSGIQGEVYMNEKEASIPMAIQTLWWEWAGYKFGNSLLQTGMTPNRGFVKKIKDILLRTDYTIAYGISEDFILEKLSQLKKRPKDHLAGYASSLFVIASVAEKNNINNIKFKSVISWGDKMFPHYKKLIETQFSTKVYDTYGCTEGLMIAAQKDLQEYYIMSPHIYIELLDSKGNEVMPGELGYVVVTRLDNYSMPLIRYYLGDIAVKSEVKSADSELSFPLLQKVIGRDTDIVKTPGGRYMIVHHFTGIFEHYEEISQFRVIQNHHNGIDIEIIPSEKFRKEILSEIKMKILNGIDETFNINFSVVKTIPATPSGKPQIIKSNLKKDFAY